MKAFYIITLFFLIVIHASAQDPNGKTDIKTIANNKKYSWFKKGYKKYKPDHASINKIKATSSITITVFAGVWCPDTQKLLPQFYKAADAAGISMNKINLYLLDKNLKSPERTEKDFAIKSIPTFIIQQNNIEIGRIIESVKQSIEEDMAKILAQVN